MSWTRTFAGPARIRIPDRASASDLRGLQATAQPDLDAADPSQQALVAAEFLSIQVEGYSASTRAELANLAGDTPKEVTAAAERGIQRIRAPTTWPTRSCVTAA